jgi:hypothetical protein
MASQPAAELERACAPRNDWRQERPPVRDLARRSRRPLAARGSLARAGAPRRRRSGRVTALRLRREAVDVGSRAARGVKAPPWRKPGHATAIATASPLIPSQAVPAGVRLLLALRRGSARCQGPRPQAPITNTRWCVAPWPERSQAPSRRTPSARQRLAAADFGASPCRRWPRDERGASSRASPRYTCARESQPRGRLHRLCCSRPSRVAQ